MPEGRTYPSATFTFQAPYSTAEFVDHFRKYYGPTMNAFEAAEKNGKAGDLQRELEAMVSSQNKSTTNQRPWSRQPFCRWRYPVDQTIEDSY